MLLSRAVSACGQITALVFEQMPDIVVPEGAGERATAGHRHRKLEIDQRRTAIGRHEPVGFFRQIIVNDVGGVEPANEFRCGAKVRGVARLRELHGRAVDPAARENAGREIENARDAVDASSQGEARQGAVFAAQELQREPARPGASAARVADDGVAVAGDGAEDVSL